MKRCVCSMAPLLEAQRDGRLGERDAASLERHLSACAECTEQSAELERMVELGRRLGAACPDRTPLEHRRARLQLLREAAAPPVRQRTPIPARRLAAAALVMAGVLGALVFGTTMLTPSGQAPVELGRWALPSIDEAGTAGAQEATVRPAPQARFERTQIAGLEKVRLRSGRIDVQVPALAAGKRFVVATADAEVEVRGTDFQVAAVSDCLGAVLVKEGEVEVRLLDETFLLRAGQQWQAPDALAWAGSTDQTQRAARADAATQASEPGGQAPDRPTTARRQLLMSRQGERDSSAAGPGEKSEHLERSAASRAFAEAVALLEHGHYQRSAERLRAFAKAHPGDPRVEDAEYLVIVAEQRAGRPGEASSAARRYIDRYPDGHRRPEAEKMAAEASGRAVEP